MPENKNEPTTPKGVKTVVAIIGALGRYPKLREKFRDDPQGTLEFMNTRFEKPLPKISEVDIQTIADMTDIEMEFLYNLSQAHGTLGKFFGETTIHKI